MLHDGRVVERGTHEALLAQEDSLYRYYHALQFRWDDDEESQAPQASPPSEVEETAWPPTTLPFPFPGEGGE